MQASRGIRRNGDEGTAFLVGSCYFADPVWPCKWETKQGDEAVVIQVEATELKYRKIRMQNRVRCYWYKSVHFIIFDNFQVAGHSANQSAGGVRVFIVSGNPISCDISPASMCLVMLACGPEYMYMENVYQALWQWKACIPGTLLRNLSNTHS